MSRRSLTLKVMLLPWFFNKRYIWLAYQSSREGACADFVWRVSVFWMIATTLCCFRFGFVCITICKGSFLWQTISCDVGAKRTIRQRLCPHSVRLLAWFGRGDYVVVAYQEDDGHCFLTRHVGYRAYLRNLPCARDGACFRCGGDKSMSCNGFFQKFLRIVSYDEESFNI